MFAVGDFHRLVEDMRSLRHSFFFSTFRMTPSVYDKLLSMVAPKIRKKVTRLRRPISASERLAVTLR